MERLRQLIHAIHRTDRELDENAETDAAPEAPHAILCQVCDRKLMGLSYPVVYRPETLDNLNLVHSSEEVRGAATVGGHRLCSRPWSLTADPASVGVPES